MSPLINKDTLTYQKKIIFNAGVEASIAYAEPKRNVVPKIELIFSPFGLPFIPIEILGTSVNKVISNMQWSADRNNPGGMLQVTITPDAKTIDDIVKIINKFSGNLYSKIWGDLGVDLEDLFKPMTLCQLWIDGYHVATVTVRGCKRSSSVSNDSKQVSYTVTLEELGNIYNQNTTSLDLVLLDGLQTKLSDSVKKALALSANIKAVPVSVGIQAILQSFLAMQLGEYMTLSDGFPLSLRLQALPNPIGGIGISSIASFLTMDASMIELNTQSVWSFLQSFIPSPWMEFFTQSGGRTIVTDGLGAPSALFPGINYVVARTTPYSNPLTGIVNPDFLAQVLMFDITALQMLIGGDFIIITDDMIEDKTLGFDSVNQATVFRTSYQSHAATAGISDIADSGIKSVGPLNPFASGGIPTFGVREMTQSIDCTSLIGFGTAVSYIEKFSKDILGLPGTILSKPLLSNLLATWFRNQSRFREGPVTTKMIPYARPGMYCLYLPALSGKKPENLRDIGIYYIDSLSHNYELGNKELSATTTLNLIRGVPLPTTAAQTALLLFDFEFLPPEAGYWDGSYTILKQLRRGLRAT